MGFTEIWRRIAKPQIPEDISTLNVYSPVSSFLIIFISIFAPALLFAQGLYLFILYYFHDWRVALERLPPTMIYFDPIFFVIINIAGMIILFLFIRRRRSSIVKYLALNKIKITYFLAIFFPYVILLLAVDQIRQTMTGELAGSRFAQQLLAGDFYIWKMLGCIIIGPLTEETLFR